LKTFEGQVLLIHNNRSPIFPRALAQKFNTSLPNSKLLSLNANTHPAAWSPEACAWVGETLGLRPKDLESTVANVATVANTGTIATAASVIDVHAHALSSTIAPLEDNDSNTNTVISAKASHQDLGDSSTVLIENKSKHSIAANPIDVNTHENTRDNSHENAHESSNASRAVPTTKPDTATVGTALHQSLSNPPLPASSTPDVSPAPASSGHSQASHPRGPAAPSESQHPFASKERGSLSSGASPVGQAPLASNESLTKRIFDHLKTLFKV
jgi:hypothetical protein